MNVATDIFCFKMIANSDAFLSTLLLLLLLLILLLLLLIALQKITFVNLKFCEMLHLLLRLFGMKVTVSALNSFNSVNRIQGTYLKGSHKYGLKGPRAQ